MQTGHELFLHGLSDILDGERQLVEALEKNAAEARQYEFILQDAIDAVDGNEKDSRELLDQLAKEKQQAKEAEKEKRKKSKD